MSTAKFYTLRAAGMFSMNPGHDLIRDAAIVHDGRFLVYAGPWSAVPAALVGSGPVRRLDDAVLCPGVFNAHTHLEMCHLLGKTVTGQGFTAWMKSLVANPMYDMSDTEVAAHCRRIKQLGTAHVADISTKQAPRLAGILDDSGIFFAAFREMIFFDAPNERTEYIPAGAFERGVLSCAGHSPYSTHPGLLRGGKAACRTLGRPYSLHLAENEEESRILMGERIEFVELLERANIPMKDFRPPKTSPVRYALELGLLDEHTLAVHCVTVDQEDIRLLAETGTNVCLCPRSNAHIGEGRAPWEQLWRAGVNLCLGTDGLCSNADLNIWNELAWMLERYEDGLDPEHALALVTRNPARALGVDHVLGSLTPGKAACWSVVPDEVLAHWPDLL
ncbi:Cytosine/adenosine deaminase [Paucidesulfovibrio gracilis DSM 16080]|uniref:Cytosine/adenosine deaminase n=1 Tax=Paucidesulfovibrio gracilis DSM 16080 TaxID=1121449 RepID=A0A1T4XVW3_9BACT|nr:amidohydrolase family protein [Paucidesulfovibrio gracilis]SKA93215.1 Cytosine/adenosine deaminase [Paucidesulfovibrio gracilis DSM 16080]